MDSTNIELEQSYKASDILPEFKAFRTAFTYCAAIVILPILCLFFSKTLLFDKIFDENTITSNIYSAIFSVIVLHIALGSFIYRAYSGADKQTKPVKQE